MIELIAVHSPPMLVGCIDHHGTCGIDPVFQRKRCGFSSVIDGVQVSIAPNEIDEEERFLHTLGRLLPVERRPTDPIGR
jgi:hypothetical protein